MSQSGITRENSVEVFQREILVTRAHDTRHIMVTVGVCPCVAVIIMGDSMSALGHLDGSPMAHTLGRVIDYMAKNDRGKLRAWIVMSLRSVPNTARRAQEILEANGVKIVDTKQPKESSGDAGCCVNVSVNTKSREIAEAIHENVGTVKMKYPSNLTPYSGALGRGRPGVFPDLVWVRNEGKDRYSWDADSFDSYLFCRKQAKLTNDRKDAEKYETLMKGFAEDIGCPDKLLEVVEREETEASARGYDDCPDRLKGLCRER
jgi:hypothetical protein